MTDLPAPLNATSIDVRDLDGFMLNAERLLASELWALATGDEFKAAVGLWCRAWKQIPAGSLPNDERVLGSFAGLTPRAWAKVRAVALRGFVLCSDGRLYHKVLVEDARRAFAKKLERKERTKAATEARNRNRYDQRNEERNVDVTKSQGQGQGQGQGEENTKRTQPPSPVVSPREGQEETAASGDGAKQVSRETLRKSSTAFNRELIEKSLATCDPLALVQAFGCSLAGEMAGEWRRDIGDKRMGTILVIFAWMRWKRTPIRLPSGFRAACQTWAELDEETRKTLAPAMLAEVGIVMATNEQTTGEKVTP